MKKIALLSLVLAVGAALAGCSLQNKTATPATTPAPKTAAPAAESFSGTMGELLAKGKSVKCTSASENNGVKTESEFYIDAAGGRSKSVVKITVAGKEQIMNSITTKEAVYTWTEGQKEGLLFAVTKTEPTAAQPTAAAPTAPSAQPSNAKYDFNCKAWNIEESVFALPSDVTFVDQAAKLNELMKNIKPVK
jgi:hypothetical protein